MKTFVRVLSLAALGGLFLAPAPAQADTVYHRVYNTYVAASDPFSILDKYQNNVLTQEEYNNAATHGVFAEVDTNNDGFVSRAEFYAEHRLPNRVAMTARDLSDIAPAAGGDDNDIVEEEICRPQF